MLEIAKIVCDVYGISVEEMQGKSRKNPLPEVRQMVIYIMFREGFTQTQTAQVIHRTRTLVCKHRLTIRDELAIYKKSSTRDKYNKIIETIKIKKK